MVWHAEHALPAGTDLVVLPGGFSYGDYLRCGAIAARAPIMDAVRAHAARGGLVLGICNGFQILCESGPAAGRADAQRAICASSAATQHLRVERNDTAFTRGYNAGQVIQVAGRPWRGQLHRRRRDHRAARRRGPGRLPLLRRPTAVGGAANPNGSTNAIAGIYSENFNVLGMMPHPENLIDPLVGGTDGRGLFDALRAAPPESGFEDFLTHASALRRLVLFRQ